MWLDADSRADRTSLPPKAASWDQVLVDPVRPQVEVGWRWAGGEFAGVGLAGVAGSILIHVAKGWGTRRWQERSRAAVAIAEAANRWTFDNQSGEAARVSALGPAGHRLMQLARKLAQEDHELLLRVYRRLLPPAACDVPIPRSVLLLRGSVAAGVVVGAVPESQHETLDAWAIAFGNALASPDQRATLFDTARDALARLPDCDSREHLEQATLLAIEAGVSLPAVGWRPFATPLARVPESAIGNFMIATLPAAGALPDAARWLAGLGGKHVRGALVVAAARLTGGAGPRSVALAADVEWLHTASLLLDDIVDEAELRRGAPALHRLTSPPFAAGLAAWILAEVAQRQPELVSTMFTLAEGQRTELAMSRSQSPTVQDWYDIAGAKTAALFSAAAAGGARSAGADSATIRNLARFGHELGIAFQLVDDILDVTGHAAQLGKPAGQDATAERPSFVAILSRELGEPPDSPAVIAECQARAQKHADRALGHLAGVAGDTAELRHIVGRCVDRST